MIDFTKINDALMSKWKNNAEFLSKRIQLREITNNEILRSSESACYAVFRNGVLVITPEKKELVTDFNKFGKLISLDDIIDADWRQVSEEEYSKSKYVRFLNKATDSPPKYVQKCLGYLCYDYKTRGLGFLIAALEGVQNGKGGGSGKGITFEMLGDPVDYSPNRKPRKKWSTLISISGQQIKKGESEMLQMWNGERIVHFSDVPRNMNLSKLKDVVTDGGSVKKLYKDVRRLDVNEYPNLGISSQWGINVEDDPGLKRRVRIISFTGYFNAHREVRDEFNGNFPQIWDEDDWIGYYNYIADGIQSFMLDRKIEMVESNDFMWEKNFDHTYGMNSGTLRDWISATAESIATIQYITSNELETEFHRFCSKYNVFPVMDMRRLHAAFTIWCERFGYSYEFKDRMWIDGTQFRIVKVQKQPVNSSQFHSIDAYK
jgi:hypothetical protein